LLQIAWGYAPGLIIEAALDCGIFNQLDKSPRTVAELAGASGASTRGLTAILNALVSLGLLDRKGARYTLTPESSAFLVSGKPGYQGAFFWHHARQLIPNWLQLRKSLRTGRPVVAGNRQSSGAKFFAHFVEGIFALSYGAARTVGEHLKISHSQKPISVLDIGAGSGVWGVALAQQSPNVKILAVDWPQVLKVTKRVARRHGVGSRLAVSPGDFQKADFGRGHQVATIGHILHSEGKERSRRLLRKTFAALAPGGTVVISEFVPNEDRKGPPQAMMFAVNMLIHTEGGDTFTFGEISGWLKEARFKNPRRLEAPAPSPLILATKP
jgi:2-polyprenyl-3-methyl-5-hydroxy-6-metoxy-1,4-benzoquinol methylase